MFFLCGSVAVVVNVIADMHSILNRIIQAINPATIPHEPHALFSTFKDSLRDGAIGKFFLFILQFIYLPKHKICRPSKRDILLRFQM